MYCVIANGACLATTSFERNWSRKGAALQTLPANGAGPKNCAKVYTQLGLD
jgi:hypothetical protein